MARSCNQYGNSIFYEIAFDRFVDDESDMISKAILCYYTMHLTILHLFAKMTTEKPGAKKSFSRRCFLQLFLFSLACAEFFFLAKFICLRFYKCGKGNKSVKHTRTEHTQKLFSFKWNQTSRHTVRGWQPDKKLKPPPLTQHKINYYSC